MTLLPRDLWRLSFAAIMAVAPVVMPASVATAVTKNWDTTNGLWTGLFGLGTNWDPDGVPEAGDVVRIVFNDGTPRTVTYNYTGPPVTLAELDIDEFSSSAVSTLSMSANNLTSTFENVGINADGQGIFDHSGGTNTITVGGWLIIGGANGSEGTYNLSSTGALVANSSEYVGQSGVGTFNQTGGANTILGNENLVIGYNVLSSGDYTLSGGSLNVNSAVEYVGYTGQGSFEQDGGTNTAKRLWLGANSGSNGLYHLDAGTLTAIQNVYVGVGGGGIFTQAGGTLDFGATLFIGGFPGSQGSYTLQGGSASGSVVIVGLSGATGVLNVTGGTLNIANYLSIGNDVGSKVILRGGTVNTLNTRIFVGGQFNWTGGALNITQGITWDSALDPASATGGFFGPSLVLDSTQTLGISGNEVLGGTGPFGLTLNGGSTHNVAGSTTISATGTLTLAGGTFNTGTLINTGTFNFIAGTLNINQAGANVNTPIVTGNPSTINVNANLISLGSAASFTGFNHQGVLNIGANTVTLNSARYARLGVLTTLAGGTINAPNGVALPSGANLQGSGQIATRVTGERGAVIEASGPLTMGDDTSPAAPAGFNYDGELRVKNYTVTLNSSAAAGLGNLTTMGFAGTGGTLNATNGYVVDFDEAVTGYGTINSTNTLAKHATINGTVQGTDATFRITLGGYIKGTGTFNNVTFSGTYSPGLSPTIVTAGNLAFASTNNLIMELGGTTPGSGYDQIQSSGVLTLGGILEISLINGFTPLAGQSFNILDWGSRAGSFSSLNLPTLAGLTWNTSQLYTTGVLSVATSRLPGDIDQDGDVDRTDAALFTPHLGTTSGAIWTTGDFDGDGMTTLHDLALQQANFGATLPSPAASANAVPEPATGLLVGIALFIRINRRGRRAARRIS